MSVVPLSPLLCRSLPVVAGVWLLLNPLPLLAQESGSAVGASSLIEGVVVTARKREEEVGAQMRRYERPTLDSRGYR